MKFIHLTDPHMVAPGQLLEGSDPGLFLSAAVASINAEHGDAAFTVVTGDLVDNGDILAYQAFRREISKLRMPVHLLLGNHDSHTGFYEIFPSAPKDATGRAQSTIDTRAGRLIFLDTSQKGLHSGALSEAALDWLHAKLSQSDRPVFLFMHHPPFPIGIKSMDAIALAEPEALLGVIAPYADRIRHLFFGHVHRAVFGTWHGIAYAGMRGLNHQMALDLTAPADTFVANRTPPAYGVVLVSDEQVTVHVHDFTEGGETFELS